VLTTVVGCGRRPKIIGEILEQQMHFDEKPLPATCTPFYQVWDTT